eukprot:GEMP01036491.1.p1 GENE.GEMP01036491.1~~GEMP01036491.1.p1  ORF type:complete len:477 (+),score=116.13 GEMP01036491.1:1-1431(+)
MASIYLEAGRIVDEVRSRRKGLKDALYAKNDYAVPVQKLKALTCKTLAEGDALQEALDHVLGDACVGTPGVALCMLYDLLLSGRKTVIGGGKLKRLLVENYAQLRKIFKPKNPIQCEPSKPSAPKTYYLRINTLFSGPVDLSRLQHELDPVIPKCVKVQGVDWETDIAPLVNCGAVAVQDRSSQLAAFAAFKENVGDVVMEVCAAPGSKTSHLIAMASSSTVRKIIAVERDPKRCRTLLERLELLCGPLRDESKTAFRVKDRFPTDSLLRNRRIRAFTSNDLELVVRCEDFLLANCRDYDEATTIVLDPSCSGSGLPEHASSDFNSDRLTSLAQFQSKMLSKVLSLPSVHTVCYSTCSVHREENEGVVEQCIKDSAWAATAPLPFTWPDPEEYTGLAALCVHSKPAVHDCRGFFLARLSRQTPPPHRRIVEKPKEGRKKKRKKSKGDATKASCIALPSSKKRKGKRKGVIILLKNT